MSEEKLSGIIDAINEILEDRAVPKNIRRTAEEVLQILQDKNKDLDLRVNKSISMFDEISDDPNMPIHIRTLIWNIVSELEAL